MGVKDADKPDEPGKKPPIVPDRKYVIVGVVVIIAGFAGLISGAQMLLGVLKASQLATEFVVFLGLALLVVGCGILGFGWAGKKGPVTGLDVNQRWSVIATFVATVTVVVMALWADEVGSILWVVISVGALGGLVHELAQSKGTAFLPGSSSKGTTGANAGASGAAGASGDKAGKDTNKDTGESYLGGLLGIVLGGAAGLLTLGASSVSAPVTTLSTALIVTAFSAGIALKGISDAAASPAVSSKKTS